MVRPKGSRSIGGWMATPKQMAAAGIISDGDLVQREQGGVMTTALKDGVKIDLDALQQRQREAIAKMKMRGDAGKPVSEPKNNIAPSPRFDKALMAKIEQERAKSGNVRFTPSEKEYLKREYYATNPGGDKERNNLQRDLLGFSGRSKTDETEVDKMVSSLRSVLNKTSGNRARDSYEVKKKRKEVQRLDYLAEKGFLLKEQTNFGTNKYKATEKGYLAAKVFEDSMYRSYVKKPKGMKIDKEEEKTSLLMGKQIALTHPTFGTKYKVTERGLDLLLKAQPATQKKPQYVSGTDAYRESFSGRQRKTADIKGLQKIKDENLVQMTLF